MPVSPVACICVCVCVPVAFVSVCLLLSSLVLTSHLCRCRRMTECARCATYWYPTPNSSIKNKQNTRTPVYTCAISTCNQNNKETLFIKKKQFNQPQNGRKKRRKWYLCIQLNDILTCYKNIWVGQLHCAPTTILGNPTASLVRCRAPNKLYGCRLLISQTTVLSVNF